MHDRTTTALPRAATLEFLKLAMARRTPSGSLALLCLDVDHFQRINSALGHAAGDIVLDQLSHRIANVIADLAPGIHGSLTLGRLDGDEFLIAIETSRPEPNAISLAHTIAERVTRAATAPFILPSGPIHITMSGGLADASHHPATSSSDDLLRDAAAALREAKASGRGRSISFEQRMRLLAARSHQLVHALREAIATDKGLTAAYQPIMDLESRTPVAVEVLARWRDPILGVVPPSEFIPIAEDNGLIDGLWDLLLHRACRDFAEWRAQQPSLAPHYLSINLSRAQALNDQLPSQISRALASFDLPAHVLQVEITESMAGHEERVRQMLLSLRGHGIQIALDDFGTGHSSLAFLQRMPLTALKLDRSFMLDAETDRVRQGMISIMVKVAALHGLKVVAEGVETEGQHALVEELGCNLGQGYLYSPPLHASDLVPWLSAAVVQEPHHTLRQPQAVA